MIEFLVNDMTCGHCMNVITKALKDIDASAYINIDIAAHTVRVESTLPAEELAQAMRDAGYTPEALTAATQ